MILLLLLTSWLISTISVLILFFRFFYGIFYDIYIFYIAPRLGKLVDLERTYGQWAIISGATDGIGLGYAHQLAGRGLNLLLMGRDNKKLTSIQRSFGLRYPDIDTRIYNLDFASKDYDACAAFETFQSDLYKEGYDIGILVDNVGIAALNENSFGEHFQDSSCIAASTILKVNVTSMLVLTSAVVPIMVKQKRGIVICISSLAGIHPMGGDATYAATKAFIDSFSRGLRLDLKGTGVEVQCVSPSFVKTKILPTAIQNHLKKFYLTDCDEYCASAVKTIGMSSETYGTLFHRLQAMFYLWMTCVLPVPIKESFLKCLSEHRRRIMSAARKPIGENKKKSN